MIKEPKKTLAKNIAPKRYARIVFKSQHSKKRDHVPVLLMQVELGKGSHAKEKNVALPGILAESCILTAK